MRVVALLCFSLFLLYPCTSFFSSKSPHIKYTKARARKFDETDFVEIKVPRPLGLDLEEVVDGVFRGVYIAGFTKDGNADKALSRCWRSLLLPQTALLRHLRRLGLACRA